MAISGRKFEVFQSLHDFLPTGPKYIHHHRAGILEIDLHRTKIVLERKQLHAVVVYIICVPFSTEILYTTTAPENLNMPNIIGNPR